MKNYSAKFSEVNNKETSKKFKEMMSGAGRFGQLNFECGFSTWMIGTDDEVEENYDGEMQKSKTLCIYAFTTYHSKETLQKMYDSNCQDW